MPDAQGNLTPEEEQALLMGEKPKFTDSGVTFVPPPQPPTPPPSAPPAEPSSGSQPTSPTIPPPSQPLTQVAQMEYETKYAMEHGMALPSYSEQQLRDYQIARGWATPENKQLMPFVPEYDNAPASQKIPGIDTKADWDFFGNPTGAALKNKTKEDWDRLRGELTGQGRPQIKPVTSQQGGDLYFRTREDWEKAGRPVATGQFNVYIGKEPPMGVEYARPVNEITITTPDGQKTIKTIWVGVDNPDAKQQIKLTPELESMKGSTEPVNPADPNGMTKGELYNILVREGAENFQRAINASNFIVQQGLQRVIRELRQYKTLPEVIEAGKIDLLREAVDKGIISKTAVVDAQIYLAESNSERQALGALREHIDSDGKLDVESAIKAGVDSTTMRLAGYDVPEDKFREYKAAVEQQGASSVEAVKSKFLSEDPDVILGYLSGSLGAGMFIRSGYSPKEAFGMLNSKSQNEILANYSAMGGRPLTFQEQIAVSPIPQFESLGFLPAGKWMAGQTIQPWDWAVGGAQAALWTVGAGFVPSSVEAAAIVGANSIFTADLIKNWSQMSPLERGANTALNVAMWVATAYSPIRTMLRGGREAETVNQIVTAGSKDTVTSLNKVSPELADSFKATSEATGRYAKDSLELQRATKDLEFAQNARAIATESGMTDKTTLELLKATEDEAVQRVLMAQKAAGKSSEELFGRASEYFNKTIKFSDDPLVVEQAKIMPQALKRAADEIVSNVITPKRTITDIRNDLSSAYTELMSKYKSAPNDVKQWANDLDKVDNLKRELITTQAGSMNELHNQWVMLKEQLPRLKAELEEAQLSGNQALADLLKETLDLTQRKVDVIPRYINNAISDMELAFGEGSRIVGIKASEIVRAQNRAYAEALNRLKLYGADRAWNNVYFPVGVSIPQTVVIPLLKSAPIPEGLLTQGEINKQLMLNAGITPEDILGAIKRKQASTPTEREWASPESVFQSEQRRIDELVSRLLERKLERFIDKYRLPDYVMKRPSGELRPYLEERFGKEQIAKELDVTPDELDDIIRQVYEERNAEPRTEVSANEQHINLVENMLKSVRRKETIDKLQRELERLKALPKQVAVETRTIKPTIIEPTRVGENLPAKVETTTTEIRPSETKPKVDIPEKVVEVTPATKEPVPKWMREPSSKPIEREQTVDKEWLIEYQRSTESHRQQMLKELGLGTQTSVRYEVMPDGRVRVVSSEMVSSTPSISSSAAVIAGSVQQPFEQGAQQIKQVPALSPSTQPSTSTSPTMMPITKPLAEVLPVTQTQLVPKVETVTKTTTIIPTVVKSPPKTPPILSKTPSKEEQQNIISNPPLGTLVYIQGRPQYKGMTNAPMFKVIPPPYTESFTTRLLPKGYKDEGYSGEGSAFKSIQILGGRLDRDIENLDLGIFKINVRMSGGKPVIEYAKDIESNAGERSMTVGQGKGQIPIEEWEKAKAQGIPFEEFVVSYSGHKVGEEHPIMGVNPPSESLDKVELPEYRTPESRVYLVNGQYIRDNVDVDFVLGGNWRVYPEFIPKNEYWIDRALDTPNDIKATLLHELVETDAMGKMNDAYGRGEEYSKAHSDYANPAEIQGRANPEQLDSMIQTFLGRFKEDKRQPPPEYNETPARKIIRRPLQQAGSKGDTTVLI